MFKTDSLDGTPPEKSLRGRFLTNEYLVKWFIFWDGLTKHCTDGALVRLTSFVEGAADRNEADERIQAFLRTVDPNLHYFIPQESAVLRET